MKLKAIALTAMLMGAGAAFAAPTLQRCAPMEVTHSGAYGLSYSLVCDAGGWNLKYTGSVPSGTDAVTAHYRVQVSNPDGSNFIQNRTVRLPSPAMLGQALIREAVLLDSGDVALRDCPNFGCTLYRPLGSAEKMAKATITVTPEVKRLSDEAARLQAELAQRKGEVLRQGAVVAELQGEVKRLTEKVSETEQALSAAKAAHEAALASAKDQYAADVSGLVTSGASELAKSLKGRDDEHRATVEMLTLKLDGLEKALRKANSDLAEVGVSNQQLKDAAESSKAEEAGRAAAIVKLQAELSATQAALARVNEGFTAQQASLNRETEALATSQAELAVSHAQVAALTSQVDALQKALASANTSLQSAQATQSAKAAASSAAQDELSARLQELADLQSKLSVSQENVSSLTAQVSELKQSLEKAQADLREASKERGSVESGPRKEGVSGAKLSQKVDDRIFKLEQKNFVLAHQLEKAERKLQEQLKLNQDIQGLSGQARDSQAKAADALRAQLALESEKVSALTLKVTELEGEVANAKDALVSAQKARAADRAQEAEPLVAQLAGAQAALAQAQSALEEARAAHQVEVAWLTEKLASAQAQVAPNATVQSVEAVSAKDSAAAEVTRLNGEVEKLTAQVAELAASRQEALLLGKQVAEDMLEMLDGVELLEKAKADAEKALESTNNKLMELSAKLEAAQLARELAMQAATTAHADADAQNIRNQELAQRLARAEEALKVSLENGKSASAAQAEIAQTSLEGLEKDLRVEKERNNLLENKVSTQEQELSALRQQLAALRGELAPAEPIPGPAPDEQK